MDSCGVDTTNLRKAYAAPAPEQASLLVYPNPADNTLNIAFKNPYDSGFENVMEVSDALGRSVVVISLKEVSGVVQLKTNTFTDGVYFLKWIDNSGKSHHDKFIIVH